VDSVRTRAERALSAGVSPRAGALLRGMVLGQDDLIDEATRDDWRASGLAHLLAVSGQNVMLLVALALPVLAAARLPAWTRAAAVAALIALYVPLAGAGPSLQRAGVMGAASLAAASLARPASRWYALLLAASVTLALNPRAHGDPGWQLSFAAVVGILFLTPGIRRGLSKAFPRLLAEGVAVTVAATLATAPLLAYSFGSVPLVGLPANVLALPLVAPIMWLGMIRAALGQLIPPNGAAGPLEGAVGSIAGIVNELVGIALGPLTGALGALARAFADLPGGQLALPGLPPALVGCAYVVMALLGLALAHLVRRAEPALQVAGAAWRRRPSAHRVAAVCALSGVVALLLATLAQPPEAPRSLTVSFLDVGQGDATLIQHPDGTAVLFDGGPPEARVARLLRRAGVRRLSAVVMTHASRDHHGGLREVVERYPVDLLVDGGDGARDHDFRSIAADAVRRGARRIEAVAPLTVRVGAIGIRVLSPPRRPSGPPPDDPNPRAVVAVVSAGGFDLLLSADAESPTLGELPLSPVDAMKVPHHGSRDPGLPQVLDRLRPRLAAVPVGENSYGHPAPSTLAALRAAGVSTHRTDREGTISVTVQGAAMRVAGERSGAVAAEP
ncbi:MAG: ComEC/Rec2 family competence protein, partial [Actinomycetota bacterium]|nr:ComEC/Rec2 family competence protein [Actinomycetota bacterium]